MALARRKPAEPVRIQLKKNDQVRVISGRDKGKSGRVLSVDSRTNKALVEHIAMVKRHTRPNPSKQIKEGKSAVGFAGTHVYFCLLPWSF